VQGGILADVRDGVKGCLHGPQTDFRYSLGSGRRKLDRRCLKCAKSGSRRSPLKVPALARAHGSDVGELTLAGAGGGSAVRPFHLGCRRYQRRIRSRRTPTERRKEDSQEVPLRSKLGTRFRAPFL